MPVLIYSGWGQNSPNNRDKNTKYDRNKGEACQMLFFIIDIEIKSFAKKSNAKNLTALLYNLISSLFSIISSLDLHENINIIQAI